MVKKILTFGWKTDPLMVILLISATTLQLPIWIVTCGLPELVWMLWWRVTYLSPACQAHSPLTVLSRQSQLPTFHLKWRAIATTVSVNKCELVCVKLCYFNGCSYLTISVVSYFVCNFKKDEVVSVHLTEVHSFLFLTLALDGMSSLAPQLLYPMGKRTLVPTQ
jgi:hypothetical protein